MYHVILFMQITEDQINLWTSNPKQFIEEEDQFARTYGVRVSAQEFLGVSKHLQIYLTLNLDFLFLFK